MQAVVEVFRHDLLSNQCPCLPFELDFLALLVDFGEEYIEAIQSTLVVHVIFDEAFLSVAL